MNTPTTPTSALNDADLDDLLEEEEENGMYQKRHDHLEMTPLNLDHLTKGQLDVTTRKSPRKSSSSHNTDFCTLLQGSCTYIAYAHPRFCSCCAVTTIILVLCTLVGSIMNPTSHYGDVSSQFDLQQGKIDHWCLGGGDDSCRCEDPLVPTSRGEFQTWTKAHFANKDLLDTIQNNNTRVAFVGESLVEEMDGRWMGQTRGAQLETMKSMFEKKFSADNGVEGVALGIAGDTVCTCCCCCCSVLFDYYSLFLFDSFTTSLPMSFGD